MDLDYRNPRIIVLCLQFLNLDESFLYFHLENLDTNAQNFHRQTLAKIAQHIHLQTQAGIVQNIHHQTQDGTVQNIHHQTQAGTVQKCVHFQKLDRSDSDFQIQEGLVLNVDSRWVERNMGVQDYGQRVFQSIV